MECIRKNNAVACATASRLIFLLAQFTSTLATLVTIMPRVLTDV